MALRWLIKQTNANYSVLRCSPVLSSALTKNFSILANKNEILFNHHKSSINYANIRTKYEKKSSGASSRDDDEVS